MFCGLRYSRRMYTSTATIIIRSKDDLMEVCQVLAERENLQVTINEVGKGALVAGVGAAFGGLVGGPLGLAVGGTIASIAMGIRGRGRYRSVVDILRNDLTSAQQRKLTDAVKKVMNNIEAQDVVTLLGVLATRTSLKEAIIKEIGTFLLQEMKLKMIQ